MRPLPDKKQKQSKGSKVSLSPVKSQEKSRYANLGQLLIAPLKYGRLMDTDGDHAVVLGYN